MTQNVQVNRGQNKAFGEGRWFRCDVAMKTRAVNSAPACQRRSPIGRRFDQRPKFRPCAAMETRRPGNLQPSAVPDAGGEKSAADLDPARSPCDKDAR